MGKLATHPILGALVLASVSISWTPFRSSVYSYSISQPSSFKHVVLPNTANKEVDYFFPSIGSFLTNVNIVAVPGTAVQNQKTYLKQMNGQNIHRSATLDIMGHRTAIVHADFNSLAGKFSIEQARFAYKETVWQLTASYELKYRKMRPLMLRMLASFRADP
jgi:hypothetical protein